MLISPMHNDYSHVDSVRVREPCYSFDNALVINETAAGFSQRIASIAHRHPHKRSSLICLIPQGSFLLCRELPWLRETNCIQGDLEYNGTDPLTFFG